MNIYKQYFSIDLLFSFFFFLRRDLLFSYNIKIKIDEYVKLKPMNL